MRESHPFIKALLIVFLMILALSGANFLFTIRQTQANAHKFCETTAGFVAITEHPAPSQSAAQKQVLLEWHERYTRLFISLGCPGPVP